jgi:hypothetical protein
MTHPAGDNHRSAEQIDHEKALGRISAVLLNLEHTILERGHKRFMQYTYYAGDSLRLI